MWSFALVDIESAKHAVKSTRLTVYLKTVVLRLKLYPCFSNALLSKIPNIVVHYISSRVSAILFSLVCKGNQEKDSFPHFPSGLQRKVDPFYSVIKAKGVLDDQDAI